MTEPVRPPIGRLLITPTVTVGVLAALLVWEAEHVGSITLSIVLAAGTVLVAILIARRVGRRIQQVSEYYQGLLKMADEQSRRAEAANQVKDEFLATLSHELRTPLNSVLGWSRLLATGKLDEAQSARAICAIERAGRAQSRLIEDLLDISRIVSGKLQISPRATLVQPLVDFAVQTMQPAADAKQIAVHASLDPAVGPIAADPDRLQQIVWNLLSNAIKFTPPGGEVQVRVVPDDQFVRVSVADTGIGFEAETLEHLFERFRQGDSSTTREYGGLGLGLGIVRHLVELHGGTVAAHSAGRDKGSEFVVRLPMRQAESFEPEITPPPHEAPLLRGISVLVVDNDPADLDFARSSLEQYGAVVRTASTAREARDRFQREPPDVLLSDLRMPDEDGLDLIRGIRQLEGPAGRRTPAAALTALVRSDDRREALNAGYQMHVAKPIDPLELASAVERLARRGPERSP
jgi:signal transduction histidine kinase/CheY-like chemotaxis protein